MSKKLMTLALALSFAVATVGVSFAKDADCTVKSVDGATVTMDCGSDAADLSVGSTVKVKAKKAAGATKKIEGC